MIGLSSFLNQPLKVILLVLILTNIDTNFDIINREMGALVIGTIAWLIVALAVGCYIISYVGRSSPLGKEGENKK
jgi:hypothetical protein